MHIRICVYDQILFYLNMLICSCIQFYMEKRERFTTTLDGELLKKLKILAINKKCSTNTILEEAIQDILQKYGESKSSS